MRSFCTNPGLGRWGQRCCVFAVGLVVAALWGCGEKPPDKSKAATPRGSSAPVRLRMATTTSTENSGLLSVLLPPFEAAHGCKVDVIAVGTGKALKLGENGDVDVVFVHARKAEDAFVAAGFGVGRRDVMYNDFVILGPKADPAGIKGLADAAAALKQIASKRAVFCSRGDDSGTHKKERALWAEAGIVPQGSWYIQTGQGMGATLTIADEKQAYVLADRGTYMAYRDKIELALLCQGDKRLFNPYGIIAVNPKRYPHVKRELAQQLIEFVTSPEGQGIIASYRKGGEQLFHPNAGAARSGSDKKE